MTWRLPLITSFAVISIINAIFLVPTKSFAVACKRTTSPTLRFDLRVDVNMSNQFELIVKGKAHRDRGHIVEVSEAYPDLQLKAGEKIIVYMPNANRGYDYLIYTNGLQTERHYKNVRLVEVTDGSVVPGPYTDPLRIFRLVGKIPKDEESKALTASNERVKKQLADVRTRKDFDKLENKLKAAIIGIPATMNVHVQSVDSVSLSSLKGKQKQMALAMKTQFLKEIDFNFEHDGYATVGKPRFYFTITTDVNGEILGGEIAVKVFGVVFEGKPTHFANLQQALDQGAEEGDIVWQAKKSYDYNIKEIEGSHEFEFTGH